MKKTPSSKSNTFLLVIIFLAVGYFGYRDYQINRTIKETESAIKQLQQSTGQVAQSPNQIVELVSAPPLFRGYFCSKEPMIISFEKDGNLKGWLNSNKMDEKTKKRKPNFEGKYQVYNEYVDLQLQWANGELEELLYKVYQLDLKNGFDIVSIVDKDGDMISKTICETK